MTGPARTTGFATRAGESLLVVGDMARLFWRVIRGVWLCSRRYSVEVARQATLLAQGSALVVMVMVFAFGLMTGIQSVYGARLIGAPSLAALGPAIGGLRELTPYAFGYIMAAKVATGYVAEIGVMRVADEIDALDTMGIDSLAYIGSTRILATWLIVPLMYGAAIVIGFAASYFVIVIQIANVSAGGYLRLFWEFQGPADLAFSVVKAMLMGTFVVLVAIYYGYRVRGGPVQVGIATTRSMIVNIVGIHFIGLLTTQAFWGTNHHLPVGG